MAPNGKHVDDDGNCDIMTEVNPLRRLRSVPVGASATVDPAQPANELLELAGRGDEAAFGQFYDLTSGIVYGTVLRVIRDPAQAEETTQDVFLELWRMAPRFDRQKGSAKAWAATVAHRRAVDRVRSEQSRRNREDNDGRKVLRSFDQVSDEVLDRLDRTRVSEALGALSETQRDAVELAYYGGKTYREVAALLDVPEGTAKTRIRDGLIKLRDHFGVAT